VTNLIFKEESYNIIGAAIEVHNELGCGFLYLKAANMKLGLLINFGGEQLEYKRLIRYDEY
jgi:hypothetical protein